MSVEIMLAVDRSVRGNASMTLFSEGRAICPVFEHVHPEQWFDSCSVARDIFDRASVQPCDITAYAVGLGPGSFSGIRSSLAFLHGMAMPYDAPVIGVSSAAASALSDSEFRDRIGSVLAVVGDARRDTAWVALYERTATGVRELCPLKVLPYTELESAVAPDIRLALVDRDSILKYLPHLAESERLASGVIAPSALSVALLAADSDSPRIEPPLPVYPHPAVQTSRV